VRSAGDLASTYRHHRRPYFGKGAGRPDLLSSMRFRKSLAAERGVVRGWPITQNSN